MTKEIEAKSPLPLGSGVLLMVPARRRPYNTHMSNLSRAVEVHEFLKVLCPDMLDADAVTALKGWKVNFTHFY